MEDDNTNSEGEHKSNLDKLREMAKSLIGRTDELQGVKIPVAYRRCKVVYRATFDDDNLPVYLGIDAGGNDLFLGFGTDDPYQFKYEQGLYLVGAITSLVNKAHVEQKGHANIDPLMPPIMKRLNLATAENKSPVTGDSDSKGKPEDKESTAESSLDELKKTIYDNTEDSEEAEAVMEELKGSLEEVKNMASEAAEFTKNMSEEERNEYMKEIAEKEEQLIAKKAREFERNLMGTLEQEDETTYNYNYFKDIHAKHGQAALKEELAKIPKDERNDIIEKIKSEYKIQKQKKDSTNEKTNDQ